MEMASHSTGRGYGEAQSSADDHVAHVAQNPVQHELASPSTPSDIDRNNSFDNSAFQRPRFMGTVPEDARVSQGSLPSGNDGHVVQEQNSSTDLALRERPRPQGPQGRPGNRTHRTCQKCDEHLTGQFVRALGGTYHLECFKCQDCGEIVASKFFPVDNKDEEGQYPLCETDYFRRLDLLCFNCGGALRGSYVTALERKYHIDHFTCSVCPTAFGAKDSYYEHEGRVYCHYHYSTRFAQRCNGCETAILKQFVEIFRNGRNQHWHPECYMIHKFWNVKLASDAASGPDIEQSVDDANEALRVHVREEEEQMEGKTYHIWSVLSAFEESSAACISDMLLHVSNGAYVEGVLVAKKFIQHVNILFGAMDRLDTCVTAYGLNGLSYGREAKLLCKRIVAFFTLLTKTQDTGVKRLGVTQELLSLVTGLAHYLKLLIRIGLQGALKLEKEKHANDGLHVFLEDLSRSDSIKDTEITLDDPATTLQLADEQSDLCVHCQQPIDDECLKVGEKRWHHKHLKCNTCQRDIWDELKLSSVFWKEREEKAYCSPCRDQHHIAIEAPTPIERITRLQQYVYLLRIALARLLSVLRSGGTLPHTSDDPNSAGFNPNEAHRASPGGLKEPPMLGADTQAKSFGGVSSHDSQPSDYERTVGEMKRLRSTRLEQRLSTTGRIARTSRIIEGPDHIPGLDGAEERNSGFQIMEDRDAGGEARTELSFEGGLTLDDIPRIVAAENARTQRPNAHKYAGNQLLSSGRQPKRQSIAAARELGGRDNKLAAERAKRYFSELSGLEYFIVRHIAVLQMQPLLEGHFNLEELLGLIELRKQNFWNKFFTKNTEKAKTGKKKGVFGVNLEVLVERDGVESTNGVGPGVLRVPTLLDDAIIAMRQMDMSVEGVFRKNGNIRGLKDLAEKLDCKETEVDLTKETPVQVAALLKKFLREMPDPLLTHKLHDLFTTSQKIVDPSKRQRVLHLTCCLLPKSHRDSMEVLFAFLNWAASFSQVDEETGSKMDTHNLATVITPNILSPDTKGVGMDESFLAIEAVNMMLDYNEEMCEVPEDIQSLLVDNELFNNMPEVTTKEILKRCADLTKAPERQFGAVSVEVVDGPPQRAPDSNGHTRAGTGVVAPRIESDAQQAHAWQKESSVRHVQGNGGPGLPQGSHQTPPLFQGQFQGEVPERGSPYHHRAGSGDSSRSLGSPNRHSQRPGGYGKYAMGVTGAG